MRNDSPLIAVIDDEEPVRKALGRLLVSAGLVVRTFSGGKLFLDSLSACLPDCAVLDLHMPDMTGFEVLADLARTGSRVPVVIITGHDSPDAEDSARRGGAAAYLQKPVNDRVLLDAIAAAVFDAHPITSLPETNNKTETTT